MSRWGWSFCSDWAHVADVRTGASAAPAEDDSSRPAIAIHEVQIGVGGSYKAGCWTPVRINLSGIPGPVAGRVEIEVADSDGVPVIFRRRDELPLEISASGEATVTLYGRFGRLRSELQVTVRNADTVLASRRLNTADVAKCWPPSQLLFVELGSSWNAAEGLRTLEQDSQAVTLGHAQDARGDAGRLVRLGKRRRRVVVDVEPGLRRADAAREVRSRWTVGCGWADG